MSIKERINFDQVRKKNKAYIFVINQQKILKYTFFLIKRCPVRVYIPFAKKFCSTGTENSPEKLADMAKVEMKFEEVLSIRVLEQPLS